MIARLSIAALLLNLAAGAAIAQQVPPIVNASPEQKLIVEKTPDGGLPPAVGVQNIQVFRATRVPEFAEDGRGWTYNHHMDLAIWKGHYLIAFTNGKVDEDVPPDDRLFVTSTDGIHWTKPVLLFPEGTSGSTRMYFYQASNDRMIAIASLRTENFGSRNAARLMPLASGQVPPSEPPAPRTADEPIRRGGMIAREVLADMKLGDPFILQAPAAGDPVLKAPLFSTGKDAALVDAFGQVLANHNFLEQEDYGKFLGSDRMAVYQGMNADFGKAFCFYHRKDGELVGVAKSGWVIVSKDEGKTWSKPMIPPGLITNNAKVWVQPTSDDKFAMVYNPTLRDRFPLVVATSDDGVTFRNMRVVHGEVPQERYPGLFKNPGAQYIRGVSMFDNDGTLKTDQHDMLIVYSMNKEDIWVSRIPVPIKSAETEPVSDHFDGPARAGFLVPDWNVYSPKWASVGIVDVPGGKAMQLEDRDPYDYARASRVFKESQRVSVKFTVTAKALATVNAENVLEIDVDPAFGTARPIRLWITPDRKLMVRNGARTMELVNLRVGEPLAVSLAMDCAGKDPDSPTDTTYSADGNPRGTFAMSLNGKSISALDFGLHFADPAAVLARLTFRTGPYRSLGTPVSNGQPTYPTPVDPATDKPVDANVFLVRDVEIK